VLSALLTLASLAIYFHLGDLEEPRRFALALATIGFFWAPESVKPLGTGLWLAAVAAAAWLAQVAGSGRGGLPLWLAASTFSALLVVQGGSRAASHYLPPAEGELGTAQRRAIRAQLRIAVGAFLAAYLFGGAAPALGAVVVALSASFFLRYVLLQAKFLGLPAVAVTREARGIVWAQRWVLLALFAVLSTKLPDALVGSSDRGPLLLTAGLLLVLAALLFVLSLVRGGFPRSFVRWASFGAGIALAVSVTAVLVELESWGPSRYRFFASAGIFFLVALPLVRDQTRLFEAHASLAALVPPSSLSAMMAPVAALNGTRWALPTTVFLAALSALTLAYQALLAFRGRAPGRLYLTLSLLVTLLLFFSASGGGAWQVFGLSVGLVLYSVDFFDRVWRMERVRARIPPS
jgi:hypothetical protein